MDICKAKFDIRSIVIYVSVVYLHGQLINTKTMLDVIKQCRLWSMSSCSKGGGSLYKGFSCYYIDLLFSVILYSSVDEAQNDEDEQPITEVLPRRIRKLFSDLVGVYYYLIGSLYSRISYSSTLLYTRLY